MADDWGRLAELLVHRRVALGYRNRTKFAEAVGAPNDRIFSDMERQRRTNFDQATRAFVEQAYQWAPGSIRAVLTGGQPVEIQPAPAEPADYRDKDERAIEESSMFTRAEKNAMLAVLRAMRGRPVDGSGASDVAQGQW